MQKMGNGYLQLHVLMRKNYFIFGNMDTWQNPKECPPKENQFSFDIFITQDKFAS